MGTMCKQEGDPEKGFEEIPLNTATDGHKPIKPTIRLKDLKFCRYRGGGRLPR